MSDTETKGQPSEQNTRKSNRQKTPNTYYKQDISETRSEPKLKAIKPLGIRPAKPKKQTTGYLDHQLITPQLPSNQLPNQQENEHKNDFNISVNSKSVELDSEIVSDAPEGSENQENHSISLEESKKSDQNNVNTSYTENEDNSNKMNIGYQTRKIHKKPKFADEHYEDNIAAGKLLIPKKLKATKSDSLKKINKLKKDHGPSAEMTNSSYISHHIPFLAQQPTTTQKYTQNNKNTQIKDKQKDSNDFLKGGLLDIFLDAVTVVQVKSETKKLPEVSSTHLETISQGFSSKNKGETFSTNITANNGNQEGNNNIAPLKKKKRVNDEDKNEAQQLENSTTQKKKLKVSKKEQKKEKNECKDDGKTNSSQSIQKEPIKREDLSNSDGILKSNGYAKVQQTIQNGTIYSFPNINSKTECITHVDKTKDKLIIHHSSMPPMEINRIFLREDLQGKLDIQRLIQQITMQQIQNQQKEQSNQTVHRIIQLMENNSGMMSKQQTPSIQGFNTQQTPQTLNMLQKIFQKFTSSQQQQSSSNQNQQGNQRAKLMQQVLLQLQGMANVVGGNHNLQSRQFDKEQEPSFAQRKLSEHFKIDSQQNQKQQQMQIDQQQQYEQNQIEKRRSRLQSFDQIQIKAKTPIPQQDTFINSCNEDINLGKIKNPEPTCLLTQEEQQCNQAPQSTPSSQKCGETSQELSIIINQQQKEVEEQQNNDNSQIFSEKMNNFQDIQEEELNKSHKSQIQLEQFSQFIKEVQQNQPNKSTAFKQTDNNLLQNEKLQDITQNKLLISTTQV